MSIGKKNSRKATKHFISLNLFIWTENKEIYIVETVSGPIYNVP